MHVLGRLLGTEHERVESIQGLSRGLELGQLLGREGSRR